MLENSRRFECTTGGSNKFYEINQPRAVYPDRQISEWVFDVEWGKIGGTPQSYVYVRPYEYSSRYLYRRKVTEKRGKGYVEVGYVEWTPGRAPTTPVRAPRARPAPPPCEHEHLEKNGARYKCRTCKTVVEFGEVQSAPDVQVFTKVRRLINLKGRKAA